ncbi:TfoX/Sxy family protein [Aureisphaera sp. CAU 1614]|uniref:TfoX/Sxy family protein n=1 Tax=Halomarinibacterium sedimenti TaxID=2857106 RepID=A0A9X1JVM0_9FLAO|nr:TfoX/Sxy family protein [Halomarinibacterium sedimenti]MBW2937895.1 TfoX/Sxy family protein [Halomarinibacterium sedimenti]
MSKTEEILKRIRVALKPWEKDIVEKKMFGGTCFLYKGKMCVGETKERLMVRVPSEKMEKALSTEFVGPMNFTGKPMKEFIFVTEKGFHTEEKLQHWIEIGVAHAKMKSEQ